jgi:hypothetical protein
VLDKNFFSPLKNIKKVIKYQERKERKGKECNSEGFLRISSELRVME